MLPSQHVLIDWDTLSKTIEESRQSLIGASIDASFAVHPDCESDAIAS